MSPELDNALCAAYPIIFKKRKRPNAAISWGVECGDGWYHIIDALCSMLYFEYANAVQKYETLQKRGGQLLEIEDARLKMLGAAKAVPVVEQVKSKFGTLRFHTRGGTDAHHAYIEMTEAISARVCEVCGAPGTRRAAGWVSTLCDAHDAENRASLEGAGQPEG